MLQRAPLITAIVLLLLPVLYVGSYCALVAPSQGAVIGKYRECFLGPEFSRRSNYRLRGVEPVFWPLEQVDHLVRPDAWGRWVDEDSPMLQRLCASKVNPRPVP
jgi:hypothetical protein